MMRLVFVNTSPTEWHWNIMGTAEGETEERIVVGGRSFTDKASMLASAQAVANALELEMPECNAPKPDAEGIMCQQMGCNSPASHRYTWPNTSERHCCLLHAIQLAQVATALGLHLQLIALTAEDHVNAASK